MEIIDKETIEKVLIERAKELKQEKNKIIQEKQASNKPIPDDETLHDLSATKASNKKHPRTRQYSNTLGIDDIIVNQGGSQGNKKKLLNEKNKTYVCINPNMTSYQKDKERGF